MLDYLTGGQYVFFSDCMEGSLPGSLTGGQDFVVVVDCMERSMPDSLAGGQYVCFPELQVVCQSFRLAGNTSVSLTGRQYAMSLRLAGSRFVSLTGGQYFCLFNWRAVYLSL